MDNEPIPLERRAGIETDAEGDPTGRIICYPVFSGNCIVVNVPKSGALSSTGFLSLPDPKPFHDEALIKASAEINEIVAKLIAKQDAKQGSLHVVTAKKGPMLVWAKSMVTHTDDLTESAAAHCG
jgi:hypothetical protein